MTYKISQSMRLESKILKSRFVIQHTLGQPWKLHIKIKGQTHNVEREESAPKTSSSWFCSWLWLTFLHSENDHKVGLHITIKYVSKYVKKNLQVLERGYCRNRIRYASIKVIIGKISAQRRIYQNRLSINSKENKVHKFRETYNCVTFGGREYGIPPARLLWLTSLQNLSKQ